MGDLNKLTEELFMENEQFNMGSENFTFDMSFSTLGRINFWLWQTNNASFNDDVHSWRKSLRNVFKEAETFLKKEDKKEMLEQLKNIEVEYSKYLSYEASAANRQFKKFKPYPPRAIFDCLFNCEVELRSLLDKEGLLMKRGEDSGKSVLR